MSKLFHLTPKGHRNILSILANVALVTLLYGRANCCAAQSEVAQSEAEPLSQGCAIVSKGFEIIGSTTSGFADGHGQDARFHYIEGIASDANGNLFIADRFNYVIRKIDVHRNVTTIAGRPLQPGRRDGARFEAQFASLAGITIDRAGVVWVTESGRHAVRRISVDGLVTTIGGGKVPPDLTDNSSTPSIGSQDGDAFTARFHGPVGIGGGRNGNVFVADTRNNLIRRVTSAGNVAKIAGALDPYIRAGYIDDVGNRAWLNEPTAVTETSSGDVFFIDRNQAIRKIDRHGLVTTLAGGMGRQFRENLLNPDLRKLIPDPDPTIDGLRSAASFTLPNSIDSDNQGNLLVAQPNAIRLVRPDGNVRTLMTFDRSTCGLFGEVEQTDRPKAIAALPNKHFAIVIGNAIAILSYQ